MNYESERKTVKSIDTKNYGAKMTVDTNGNYQVIAFSKITKATFEHIPHSNFVLASLIFDRYALKGQ